MGLEQTERTKEGEGTQILSFSTWLPLRNGSFELGSSNACLFSFPIVGEPLPIPRIKKPNKKTVDKYHALYISALRKLFEQHKVHYGLPETQELTII